MRTSKDIVSEINQFKPKEGNWLGLDGLLEELWTTGDQESYTRDLLKVFERFPEEDGLGVFWSIVHGVEHFKEYEQELFDSLKRQPSAMGFVMLHRIKNTGAKTIGGVKISTLIAELLSNQSTTPRLRQYLEDVFEKS